VVDRIAPVRHHRQVKDWILVGQRVVAGVVAKGTLDAQVVGIDIALQDDFRMGWHFDIHGAAFDRFHRGAPQEASEEQLVNGWR
jgi:hypothetical protein